MDHLSSRELENFKNDVGIKFQLYNSLFTSLPFHRIERTGILLSLFLTHCEEGYRKKLSPPEIVEQFFARYTSITTPREGTDLLFRFVQYAERQVVLFDALEDAAIKEINDTVGVGTLKQLESKVVQEKKEAALIQKLREFSVSLVLTAHPTQFYPDPVLGIITDLSKALRVNDASLINVYLQQLGKTPLFKKQRPTPYDEAVSLIWYLENVFYQAVGKITYSLRERFAVSSDHPIIKMGFWPGGDRDGNPNVTAGITLKVAAALHSSIVKCYYRDVTHLKRRLTFKGIDTHLNPLEAKLYSHIFLPDSADILTRNELLKPLFAIREIIVHEHNGLFLDLVDQLIGKVQIFGLHFATLDIRQESSVHGEVLQAIADHDGPLPGDYETRDDNGKIEALTNASGPVNPDDYEGMVKDTILSVQAMRTIQQRNGEQGCDRYIISQCNSALNVLEVYGLFLLGGWKKEELHLDIVPLFETIDDLHRAPAIMEALYNTPAYREHLERRGKVQTIMVGFSDGTKDGGYLMANWSIYQAKENLTAVSRRFGIDVIFFDGRGGPPARGGGKTHKFYASMGSNISAREIHLTIQGQTVTSSFGNIDAAQFNIEQLMNAGISNGLFTENGKTLDAAQEAVIQELSDISYDTYRKLKDHPDFFTYLSEVSPLNYYSDTNISSRPAKRGKTVRLSLKDLRAIPFVGAWSQLKQNVPGYYGLGTALQAFEEKGRFEEVRNLYQQSPYFKTLIDNCEMVMKKSFFPLTAYLSKDPRYAEIWNLVFEEYERTEKYLLKLSGQPQLMNDYPVEALSIQMRERIVLPLTTIQQYALSRLRTDDVPDREALERLIVRTSFGIINAGRNAV